MENYLSPYVNLLIFEYISFLINLVASRIPIKNSCVWLIVLKY